MKNFFSLFKHLNLLILALLIPVAYGASNLNHLDNIKVISNHATQALCGAGGLRFNCYLKQITYNSKLGQFIAVGTRDPNPEPAQPDQQIGFIALSPDGVSNWQAVAVPDNSGRLSGVEKSGDGNTYIAVLST